MRGDAELTASPLFLFRLYPNATASWLSHRGIKSKEEARYASSSFDFIELYNYVFSIAFFDFAAELITNCIVTNVNNIKTAQIIIAIL